MNILILVGSRNPQGQTARAAAALSAGAQDRGAHVETVFLPTLGIERCRQCDDEGWGICRREGRCIINDDFGQIVSKIRAADAVVFATPVYFGDLSESVKAFTDRLRRTCCHAAGKDGIGGKAAIGICVAGGGGGGAINCCQHLEKVLSTIGMDVQDLIPVRRQNLAAKTQILAATGKQLLQPKAEA
jgi:multimeric flavodoxin WrbA